MRVIDLDSYSKGPFRNQMGRMFGSERFMAPEEHRLGAWIDERTTVFTLGRTVHHLVPDGGEEMAGLVGVSTLLCKWRFFELTSFEHSAPPERIGEVALAATPSTFPRGYSSQIRPANTIAK